jgi:hypothetical protein
MTGSGHHGNEGHKFLKVTFPISIFIQCFHDFVYNLLLFDFLRERRDITQCVFKLNVAPSKCD